MIGQYKETKHKEKNISINYIMLFFFIFGATFQNCYGLLGNEK